MFYFMKSAAWLVYNVFGKYCLTPNLLVLENSGWIHSLFSGTLIKLKHGMKKV